MTSEDIPVTLGKLASVLFLVLLNGFFVAAEFSLVKIRDTQLETLAVRGNRRASIARRIVANLDAALSATQLGITIASLGLGWLGKPVFAALLEPVIAHFHVGAAQADWIAFAVGFTIITFLHIVLGELAPKSLAIQRPLETSLWVARPLQWFYILLYPAIWLLNHAAFWLLRRCGLQPLGESDSAHSEEEIRLILNHTQSNGKGPVQVRDIALNAFALRRRRTWEVMKARREIVGLNSKETINQCLAIVRQNCYSQYPLCAGGDVDDVIGVVSARDVWETHDKAKYGRDLHPVMREIVFVPESALLEQLLGCFIQRKLSLALVVDEFGTTSGLVTLNDVVRQLVGRIEDDFSDRQPDLKRTGAETWELSGSVPVQKLSQFTRRPVTSRAGASTVSGLIIRHLGRFPCVGDSLSLEGMHLRVEEIVGMRITRMKLRVDPDRSDRAPIRMEGRDKEARAGQSDPPYSMERAA